MIVHLKSIPKEHSLIIMNPGLGLDKFFMAFAREIYLTPPASRRVRPLTIKPNDTAAVLSGIFYPTVYAVLNEENRTWVIPWLKTNVPTIQISAYKKDNRIIYWLGVAPDPHGSTQLSSDTPLPTPLR
jgi:hypothetical protein